MKRALVAGLIGGMIISLAGLYPLIALLVPRWLVGWERPFTNEVHTVWLVGSAVLGLPVLVGLGFWVARRAQAVGWRRGALLAGLAGVVASLLIYLALFLPARALFVYGRIATPIPEQSTDLLSATATLLRQFAQPVGGLALQAEWLLPGLVLLWLVEGAIFGWRRRDDVLAERPSLLELLQAGEPLKKWFAGDEMALRLGLAVGSVMAIISVVSALGWMVLALVQNWLELAAQLLPESWLARTDPLAQTSSLLFPILLFVLVNLGFVVVLLLKNPVDRRRARVTAVWLATLVVTVAFVMVLLHVFYLAWGIVYLWMDHWLAANPNVAAETIDSLQRLKTLFQNSGSQMATVFLAPWLACLLALLAAFVLGGWQALLVVPVLTFRPRPVDRAAQIRRRTRQQPDELLPIIYNLFNQTPLAYDVLAHLAIQTRRSQPTVATLTAALHTLGHSQSPAQPQLALATLVDLLAEQRSWRWATELGTIYQTLQAVLPTRTLADIQALILPPPPNNTSLPPLVLQNGRQLSRITHQLQKVVQAEDLPTRLIFLENGATALAEAQAAVQEALGQTLPVPLPHLPVLAHLLHRWQEIVQAEIAQVKGQAELVVSLQTRQSEFVAELPLVWRVQNQGLGSAKGVRLQLLPDDGYHLLGIKSEVQLEVLLPGAQQAVTLFVVPEADQASLELSLELRFTAAAAAEQLQIFRDRLTFVKEERPFLPIQPNPYITNTPLKPGDFFVGRTDLFRFIQANLASRSHSSLIVLQSERRMGKSSALYRLPAVLADSHFAVVLDMQSQPASGEADFLYALADEIVFALAEQGIAVELPSRSEFTESPQFFFRSRFLRGLLPQLGDKKLLLLLDHFEALQQRVEDGRLPSEIFHFFHTLMQHESRLDFIVAGMHPTEMTAGTQSGLFDNAVYRPLAFLTTKEMHQLITDPVAAYIEYDPPALERMGHLAAGQPYLTQLLLHELVVYHNEMEASYLTTVDVDQVVERIVQRGETHFRYLWADATEEERLALRALAEMSRSGEAVTLKALRQFLGERGHVSTDRWQTALNGLESRELLLRQPGKLPLYHFRAELIRLWVDHMPPLL